jgi:hypothetical protein
MKVCSKKFVEFASVTAIPGKFKVEGCESVY